MALGSIVWSKEQLEVDRSLAEQIFIRDRQGEGPDEFYATCKSVEPQVVAALDATQDLLTLTGDLLLAQPRLWRIMRYFCAPPISEEDLWTIVGSKFKITSIKNSEATAAALKSVIDGWRFPWVAEAREPHRDERLSAIKSTTVLVAHETLKTSRRGSISRTQELVVADILEQSGLVLDKGRSRILRLDELERGRFSRERKVDGAKCDLPIRLHDGRLLALECKVSNGPKNGWKRLQRETGGKAERWRSEFGSQVTTGALLAGVFDLKCLLTAQDEQHVALFWQHDLQKLLTYIESTRP